MDLRDKSVWQLTSAELYALDPQERQWAISHVGFLKESGALAIISANPPGTTYETVWDSNGGWKMQPVCRCDQSALRQREFVENYIAMSPAYRNTPSPTGEVK